MILGAADAEGVPHVTLPLAGRTWRAVVDTGSNGDLELPSILRTELECEYAGRVVSSLAAGRMIEGDAYVVRLPFDGETVVAEATFVPGDEILIGTRLLRNHTLTIDFPAGTARIERTAGS